MTVRQRGGGNVAYLDRIAALDQVQAKLAAYRTIAEGTFPAPLRISIHGAGRHQSDIDRWVADPVGWRPEGTGGRCMR